MLHVPPRLRSQFPLAAFAALLLTALFCAPIAAQTTKNPAKGGRVNNAANLPGALDAAAPGKPRPTRELIVFLKSGADVRGIARDYSLSVRRPLSPDAGVYLLAAESVQAAQQRASVLRLDKRAEHVFVNEYVNRVPHAFVPDDPYFAPNTTTGYGGQWHLSYLTDPTVDVHAMGAWARDITGQGVNIGVIDDGVERTHPDLVPNYVPGLSYDFGFSDPDPSPAADDWHGTAVAGVAAARGGNGIGVTGAAPHAGLAGLRIRYAGGTTAMFVEATMHQSTDATSNIQVKNHSYGYGKDAAFIPSPAEVLALEKSSSAGTIHVFSAGNSRGSIGEDCARDMIRNHPAALAVAAMGSNGKFANYSSYGSNVFVTAPSASYSAAGLLGIATTDRLGDNGYNGTGTADYFGDPFPDTDYTSGFNGTSASAPLVSGIMALVKQANPRVDIRLVKHLLAITSDVVDAADVTVTSDNGWKTNGAGLHFNPNYGFGLIDADELTLLAPRYAVTALQTETIDTVTVNADIPDGPAEAAVEQTFEATSTTPLEEVMVHLDITHTNRGNITAFLTSPMGTRSRLIIASSRDTGQNINWTLLSNAFWGEVPQGTWKLEVLDVLANSTGKLNSFSATLRMGTMVEMSTLQGKVTLGETGLAGVTIKAVGPTTVTTTTGDDGTYKFENLPVGTYTVTPNKTGHIFEPTSLSVILVVDAPSTADFAVTVDHHVARDIAAAGDGSDRILLVGLTSTRIMKVTGSEQQWGDVYDIGAGWTPLKNAAGADGKTYILWTHTTGLVSLWRMNEQGTREWFHAVGPYGGWTAKDIAVASDGSIRILFTSAGAVVIVKVTGRTVSFGSVYAIGSGWTPLSIAAGPGVTTHLLWSHTSGLATMWRFNNAGVREWYHALGPYYIWKALDASVAGDGSLRILYRHDTEAIVVKLTGKTVQFGFPYSIDAGWSPVGIAAGSDQKSQILWSHTSEQASLWRMNSSGVRERQQPLPPY